MRGGRAEQKHDRGTSKMCFPFPPVWVVAAALHELTVEEATARRSQQLKARLVREPRHYVRRWCDNYEV